MDKEFLIAVSEHKSALLGVRFLCNFFSDKKDIRSTLFYSAPKPPAVWENEKSLEASARQKAQAGQIVMKGKAALEDARKECVNLGFPLDNISLKLQTRVFSTVADIIQEGEKGLYDAVVLGRRGLSMIEEAFEDSVSKAFFNQTFTFPLWLCRASNPDRKNVLLYLDGSDISYRMADHAGFVLSHEKKHCLDILIPRDTADPLSVMEKCRAILSGHDLPEELIRRKTAPSGDPAGMILDAVQKEHYAAVALGRSGREKSLLMRLFKGPVCSVLFKQLEEAALWICH